MYFQLLIIVLAIHVQTTEHARIPCMVITALVQKVLPDHSAKKVVVFNLNFLGVLTRQIIINLVENCHRYWITIGFDFMAVPVHLLLVRQDVIGLSYL